MKQINEKQLFFEKGELSPSECVESLKATVEIYNHSTVEQRKIIENRLRCYYPWLANSLVEMCRSGICNTNQQEFTDFVLRRVVPLFYGWPRNLPAELFVSLCPNATGGVPRAVLSVRRHLAA